jgi:hypothetical protein
MSGKQASCRLAWNLRMIRMENGVFHPTLMNGNPVELSGDDTSSRGGVKARSRADAPG